MKNKMKFLFTLFALFVAYQTIAQEFNATITYSITYKNLPEEFEAYKSSLPNTMKVFLKGSKSKTVQVSPISGNTTTISDDETQKVILLMEYSGSKKAMILNNKEAKSKEKWNNENIKIIEQQDFTTKILGYNCKKALIYLNDESEPLEVYYTEEIKVPDFNKQFKKLNGYPLKYTLSQNGLTMEYEAQNIDFDLIDDKEFEIPDGYQIVSYPESNK